MKSNLLPKGQGLLCAAAVLAFAVIVRVAQAQTLADALNTTNITWTTSGTGSSFGWSPQTSVSHDGVSAAGSGGVSSYSSSSLQATVTGPGTLSFWWCDRSSWNAVTLTANGTKLASLNSYPSWQQQTLYLPAGSQSLKWTFAYSSPGDSLQAYVDQVAYTPGATSPAISAQPICQSQVAGCSASFSVTAGGTPPLYYQWHFNGNDIEGATTNTLTITNVTAESLGVYTVTVSNSVGTLLSSNATLEFGEVTAWGVPGYVTTMVPVGATNLLALAAGSYFSFGLKPDGTLLAWGSDIQGEVSNAATITNAIAVAAGEANCLALRGDGTVVAWGVPGQAPTNVPPDLTNAVAISCSLYHATALTSDGRVVAWSTYSGGQTNVPHDLTDVVAIAAGWQDNLALKADGTVVTWSSGTATATGLSNIVAIAEGSGFYLALRDDGTVTGWGWNNSYGQATPPAGLSNVVAIAAGDAHSLALRADGTAVAWGYSSRGLTNVPTALSNVVAIAAGSSHLVAMMGSGPPITKAETRNPCLSGAAFTVSVPSQSGRVYALEYKNAANDAAWTHLRLVAGTGKTLVLRDPSPGAGQRFYRVRRW